MTAELQQMEKCRELARQSRLKANGADTAAMREVYERSAAVWEREAKALERRMRRDAGSLADVVG